MGWGKIGKFGKVSLPIFTDTPKMHLVYALTSLFAKIILLTNSFYLYGLPNISHVRKYTKTYSQLTCPELGEFPSGIGQHGLPQWTQLLGHFTRVWMVHPWLLPEPLELGHEMGMEFSHIPQDQLETPQIQWICYTCKYIYLNLGCVVMENIYCIRQHVQGGKLSRFLLNLESFPMNYGLVH